MGKRNSKAYPERNTRTESFPKTDIQGERSEPSISGILHPEGKRFPQGDKTPLEEWIHNLNTDKIPESANAPGVNMVKEKLKIDRMNKTAKAYYRHLDNI